MLTDYLRRLDKKVTAGQSAQPQKVAVLMIKAVCKPNKADFHYYDIIKNLLADNYNATPRIQRDVMSIVYAILSGVAGDYTQKGLHVLETNSKVYVALES